MWFGISEMFGDTTAPPWVGSRSPDGLVVGSCTSHPGVLGSIPKREEPGKTGAPCVKVPGSSRVSFVIGPAVIKHTQKGFPKQWGGFRFRVARGLTRKSRGGLVHTSLARRGMCGLVRPSHRVSQVSSSRRGRTCKQLCTRSCSTKHTHTCALEHRGVHGAHKYRPTRER
jgi:hypothetical protein